MTEPSAVPTEVAAEARKAEKVETPAGACPRAHDAQNFLEVLDRYQGSLLRYARRAGAATAEEAEDVVQECFLRLHRAWAGADGPAVRRVGAWLFTVTHNLTMDLVRRQGRRKALAAQRIAEAEAELCVLTRLTQSEAAAAAVAALDRLGDQQKQVVLLKVLEGLTFRQIAKATGIPLATVNRRLQEGLLALASELKRAGHL